jgi:hypothetical protein
VTVTAAAAAAIMMTESGPSHCRGQRGTATVTARVQTESRGSKIRLSDRFQVKLELGNLKKHRDCGGSHGASDSESLRLSVAIKTRDLRRVRVSMIIMVIELEASPASSVP